MCKTTHLGFATAVGDAKLVSAGNEAWRLSFKGGLFHILLLSVVTADCLGDVRGWPTPTVFHTLLQKLIGRKNIESVMRSRRSGDVAPFIIERPRFYSHGSALIAGCFKGATFCNIRRFTT